MQHALSLLLAPTLQEQEIFLIFLTKGNFRDKNSLTCKNTPHPWGSSFDSPPRTEKRDPNTHSGKGC